MAMKRPRRHKFISAGVFFLVYSVLYAVSQDAEAPVPSNNGASVPVKAAEASAPEKAAEASAHDKAAEASAPDKAAEASEPVKAAEVSEAIAERTAVAATDGEPKLGPKENEKESETKETKTTKATLSSGASDVTKDTNDLSSTSTSKPEVHTLRPRRINCTAPAIEQFPDPLIGPYTRRHGGLIIHVLLAIFSFLGLAIVCDDYFVSSLDRLCEELKLSPDVAGATFMAAGSSAPELATVIIGVFFAKDDIGISGVIGSAVFNIMFVISVCALCSGTVIYLNWWPLCRDCFFYAVSILVMLFTISNEVISWPESLVMLLMYVVYCIVLHFNTPLERWAMSLKLPIKLPTKEEQASLVTYKSAVVQDPKKPESGKADLGAEEQMAIQPNQVGYNTNIGYDNEAYYHNQEWDPNASWGEQGDAPAAAPMQAPVWDPNRSWDTPEQSQQQQQQVPQQPRISQDVARTSSPVQAQLTIQASGIPNQSYYRPKEYKPEELVNPLIKPTDAGVLGLAAWYIVFPIHFLCRKTTPDCKSEKYRNWYPFTFIISMMWISFYSYIMVWMITIIGSTLGIPDTVMGLTFVAAGVSVPDALSSIAVIKEGYGDMAVSNAVGSNVFDILICLGLPWFIQTAIIKPGSHVNVISKGLTYSTLSLLSTVIFLVFATHLNGWKLDRKYGIILMIWYLIFITFASLYELNIFGYLHYPECESRY